MVVSGATWALSTGDMTLNSSVTSGCPGGTRFVLVAVERQRAQFLFSHP